MAAAKLSDVVPSEAFARQVRALIAKHGVNKTSELLGVGREVVNRFAARSPVRRGSLLMGEQNLAALESRAVVGGQ